MKRPGALVRLATAATVVALAAVGTPAMAATTTRPASTRPASTRPATTGMGSDTRPATIDRFNVANTHSPQVERLLAAGSARPPGVRPHGAPAVAAPGTTASAVQGIDIASVQHSHGASIDWSQVAGAGYKFVFIKAAEGSYYRNRYYAGDAAAAAAWSPVG